MTIIDRQSPMTIVDYRGPVITAISETDINKPVTIMVSNVINTFT